MAGQAVKQAAYARRGLRACVAVLLRRACQDGGFAGGLIS